MAHCDVVSIIGQAIIRSTKKKKKKKEKKKGPLKWKECPTRSTAPGWVFGRCCVFTRLMM